MIRHEQQPRETSETADQVPALARGCRHCNAPLPAIGPKGGRPYRVCAARRCQVLDLHRRKALVLLRRWRLAADRRGDGAAVERFDARIAALTPE